MSFQVDEQPTVQPVKEEKPAYTVHSIEEVLAGVQGEYDFLQESMIDLESELKYDTLSNAFKILIKAMCECVCIYSCFLCLSLVFFWFVRRSYALSTSLEYTRPLIRVDCSTPPHICHVMMEVFFYAPHPRRRPANLFSCLLRRYLSY